MQKDRGLYGDLAYLILLVIKALFTSKSFAQELREQERTRNEDGKQLAERYEKVRDDNPTASFEDLMRLN